MIAIEIDLIKNNIDVFYQNRRYNVDNKKNILQIFFRQLLKECRITVYYNKSLLMNQS
jgi:hypothetical protein